MIWVSDVHSMAWMVFEKAFLMEYWQHFHVAKNNKLWCVCSLQKPIERHTFICFQCIKLEWDIIHLHSRVSQFSRKWVKLPMLGMTQNFSLLDFLSSKIHAMSPVTKLIRRPFSNKNMNTDFENQLIGLRLSILDWWITSISTTSLKFVQNFSKLCRDWNAVKLSFSPNPSRRWIQELANCNKSYNDANVAE